MKRHLQLLLLSILAIAVFSAAAQEDKTAKEGAVHREKIAWFAPMSGEWEGEVRTRMPDGTESVVYQHEDVEFELDGTILEIEGTGRDADGNVVFNAMAVICFDATIGDYRMFAFRRNGHVTEANVEITGERKFAWSFSPQPSAEVRYEVDLSREGRWLETGYFVGKGSEPVPFLTMDLTRLDN